MRNLKRIETSKGNVEYYEIGKGEVILCLHGAMGGWDQSDCLGKTIGPEGYRYIALSRPGYLGTDLSIGKTPEEQADIFSEILDKLNINKVIVMAISGGGYSAIYFALRYPDKCKALVLASTTGGPNNEKIPFTFKVMMFLSKFPFIVNGMRNGAEKNFIKSLDRSIPNKELREKLIKNESTLELFKGNLLSMFYKMEKRISGTKNDIFQTKDRTYPLKDIKVPTLIIHGEKDEVVPFEKHAKRLAEEIPNARLFVAKNAGHVAIFTHRDDVQKVVREFLQNLSNINMDKKVQDHEFFGSDAGNKRSVEDIMDELRGPRSLNS